MPHRQREGVIRNRCHPKTLAWRGIDPTAGTYPSLDDVGAQTLQAPHNLVAILEAAGSTPDDVIVLRCYLTTRDHFPAMNATYTEFMTGRVPSGVVPARTAVFVRLPLPGMLVEIDALAVIAD